MLQKCIKTLGGRGRHCAAGIDLELVVGCVSAQAYLAAGVPPMWGAPVSLGFAGFGSRRASRLNINLPPP